MIHNSVIIELPGSSCQHRKYLLPTAATPLQNKSSPRLGTLHFQLQDQNILTLFPDERTSSGGDCDDRYRLKVKWSDPEPRRADGTERARRFLQPRNYVCPNKTSPSAAATKQATKWVKKQKNKKNHGSLWRRVNKPTVQLPISRVQNISSVQESNRRQKRPKSPELLGECFISFYCFFYFIFIIAMEK